MAPFCGIAAIGEDAVFLYDGKQAACFGRQVYSYRPRHTSLGLKLMCNDSRFPTTLYKSIRPGCTPLIVALGDSIESWVFVYKDNTSGTKFVRTGRDTPAGLRDWITQKDGGLKQQDILGVTMGIRGGWIGWTELSWKAQEIRKDLADFMADRKEAGDPYIRLAALGHRHGYFVLTQKGAHCGLGGDVMRREGQSLSDRGRMNDIQVRLYSALLPVPWPFDETSTDLWRQLLELHPTCDGQAVIVSSNRRDIFAGGGLKGEGAKFLQDWCKEICKGDVGGSAASGRSKKSPSKPDDSFDYDESDEPPPPKRKDAKGSTHRDEEPRPKDKGKGKGKVYESEDESSLNLDDGKPSTRRDDGSRPKDKGKGKGRAYESDDEEFSDLDAGVYSGDEGKPPGKSNATRGKEGPATSRQSKDADSDKRGSDRNTERSSRKPPFWTCLPHSRHPRHQCRIPHEFAENMLSWPLVARILL